MGLHADGERLESDGAHSRRASTFVRRRKIADDDGGCAGVNLVARTIQQSAEIVYKDPICAPDATYRGAARPRRRPANLLNVIRLPAVPPSTLLTTGHHHPPRPDDSWRHLRHEGVYTPLTESVEAAERRFVDSAHVK